MQIKDLMYSIVVQISQHKRSLIVIISNIRTVIPVYNKLCYNELNNVITNHIVLTDRIDFFIN